MAHRRAKCKLCRFHGHFRVFYPEFYPDRRGSIAFERPGMTEEKFAAILAKQTPDGATNLASFQAGAQAAADIEKRQRADFIVDSTQPFDHARAQMRDNPTSRDVVRLSRKKVCVPS